MIKEELNASNDSGVESITSEAQSTESVGITRKRTHRDAFEKANQDYGNGLLSFDKEIFEAAKEDHIKYRQKLKARQVKSQPPVDWRQQLKEKEKTIAFLKDQINDFEKQKQSDKENNETQEKTSSTTDLLDMVKELQAENESLKSQLDQEKAMLQTIRKEKRKLEKDLFEREIKITEGCRKDIEIESLRNENKRLMMELHSIEDEYIAKEIEWRKKVLSLQHKLIDTEVLKQDHLDKQQDRIWETILSYEKKIRLMNLETCKNKEPTVDLGDLHKMQNDISSLKASQQTLKQQSLHLPQLLETMMLESGIAIKKALIATEKRCTELQTKYGREMSLRKRYHNQLVELRGNIRVFCRARPWIKEDGETQTNSILTYDALDDGLLNVSSESRSHQFEMDKVFPPSITQEEMFNQVSDLIRSVLDGYNVCIFAYGQTGSGKTFTMEGSPENPGINQRALSFLYNQVQTTGWTYDIEIGVVEIYNESIIDLLNSDPATRKLDVKMKPEGGLHVPGQTTVPVHSVEEINQIFERGRRNRSVASTNMNEHSSRSHCLFTISASGQNTVTGDKTFGRLNLVDLAGSERVSKSHADGARLKEAQNINKSLSALGDVINALKNKHSHIPYRNSKLTYLLQESLGGDSKTLMILQVSPAEKNSHETVCTLTFGQRVRSAELGAAQKNVDEGGKGTPTSRNMNRIGTPSSGRRHGLGTPVNQYTGHKTPSSSKSNRR